MTAVIWDGKTLATDSQMTMGHGTISLAEFKKIYTPDPEKEYWEVNGKKVVAFAVAGDAKCVDYIKHELHKGINFRTQVEVEDELFFGALLITEDHMCYDWTVDTNKEKRNTWSSLIPIFGPVCKGSGGRFALSVVAIGKDAKTAIKAAIRLDAFSGGAIQEFSPGPVPETPSVRPEHLKVVEEKKEDAKSEEDDSKDKGKGKSKDKPKAA